MSSAHRLSRNTLILLVSNGGSAILSFVLAALIGRALGQDGLGIYSTALAWVTPLVLVSEFGINSLIVREAAQDSDATKRYLPTAFRIYLLTGLTMMTLLATAASFLSDNPAVIDGLRISAPFLVISPFFGAFTAVFRARQVMWPIPPLNVGMLAVQVALTGLVLANGGDARAALIVNMVTSAGQLAAGWWIWRRYFSGDVKAHSRAPLQITDVLRRAWPFALAALLAAIQARVGTILLERLTNVGEAGTFAAAARFVEAGRVIPNALFGALFPALAALAAAPDEMNRLFRRVMFGLGLFGAGWGIAFTLLAAPALQLVYGETFVSATPTLIITSWVLLPGLLRSGRTLYWYARGREGLVNIITFISLAVQIGLSLWLIPRGGAVGAALVSVVVEIVALVLMWR